MEDNYNKEITKEVEETELEKVDGGMTSAFIKLKSELSEAIPTNVWEELRVAKNEKDFRKMLEEKGIDVEKIKKRSRTTNLNLDGDCGQDNTDKLA